MNRSEKIAYLANVLAVATCDGEVNHGETVAMQAVMLRLGAGPDEFQEAERLLAAPSGYDLTPLADSADCMACIEDMVLIALADGTLRPAEAEPIEAFTSALGFAQADMDMLMPRVRQRARLMGLEVSDIQQPRPPVKPRTASKPDRPPRQDRRDDHRFERRERAAPVSLPPPLPTSAEPSAHDQAPVADGSPEAAPPQPPATRQPAPAPSVNAKPAHQSENTTPLAACQLARQQSPAGAAHCWGAPDGPLNPWGCRLLGMDWDPSAAWFAHGHFRDGDTFVFDRAAIRTRLEDGLEGVRTCPYLDRQFALAACDALPSRATTAGRWRHRRCPANAPGAKLVRAQTYRHGCGVETACWSDALVPTNDRDAVLTIARAARRLGHPRHPPTLNSQWQSGRRLRTTITENEETRPNRQP
ncbi:MAG: hypothetical protein PHR35_11840 [Kiritimatiellae bacterium]|nr:hypothetical protein [Kiritimatiellia bacterium]